jgi:hypothetical protein
MGEIVCQAIRGRIPTRIPLDRGLSMRLEGQFDSSLIKFMGSSVALARYAHFREDTYRFVILKDLINEEVCGGEPMDTYLKGAIPVCGRDIAAYKRQFLFDGEIPLDERLERSPDELYVEIGPGFSELVVREAINRERRGGAKPLAIDPFEYRTAVQLLSVCTDLHPTMQMYSDASNPLVVISAREALERMEVMTSPQLVTLVPQFFSKKEHLPKTAQDYVDKFGGAHTLVDVYGGGMYVPIERSTNPELEMRRLLKPTGKLYSN